MSRRKPPRRVQLVKSADNQNRELSNDFPSLKEREELAATAKYDCHSKHKLHPSAYRLQPYAGVDVMQTYCDADAQFQKNDIRRIPMLLRRGIMAGLWGSRSSGGFPAILWTIDDNGWIYELRITNSGQSQYHGYPLLSSGALTKKVIQRFSLWTFTLDQDQIKIDPHVKAALAAAQDRYR